MDYVTKTKRPAGREEVRAAVLRAAERQFAAHGTRARLRDIANDAGVNVGLIHRHFGNKDDVLQAVLNAQRQVGVEHVSAAPDLATAVRQIFEDTRTGDEHIRTLAWLFLESDDAHQLHHEYPAVAILRAAAGNDPGVELRLLIAMTVTYGWTIFGTQLLPAFGHPASTRPDVERAIAHYLETLLRD
jgi:AcrR family transcriptional regulator